MTKRLLILIMALLLVCASCLADEQVVVDSFKVHVQDIMQPVLATYKKDAVHIRYFDPSKAEKSYLSNAMQHWRFYYGYQNGKWEKTKVEFYRNTEKRFMSDKITITEYDVFANRQNKGVYLLFIANGAGTDS